MSAISWCFAFLALVASGCGTTRMSDSARTANEQLLISNAVDMAIGRIRFDHLAGRSVYLDPQYLKGAVDENYIVSAIRQQLLANGCLLKERREDADYIVEARAGTVGTNRHDLLIGIPSVNLPSAVGLVGMPSAIPEIPFAKSTDQRGVAKLAVYAYNRATGEPIWQSGSFPVTATAKDTWVLGTGPFQRGTIYDGTRFAGSRIKGPFARWSSRSKPVELEMDGTVPLSAEVVFGPSPRRPSRAASDPANIASAKHGESNQPAVESSVQQAAANESAPADDPPAPVQPQILRMPQSLAPEEPDEDTLQLLPTPGDGPLGRFFEAPRLLPDRAASGTTTNSSASRNPALDHASGGGQ